MGREVRKVPANWQHPTDNRGEYIPLFDSNFTQTLTEWNYGKEMWEKGLRDDWNNGWKKRESDEMEMTWVEWHGEQPQAEDYMPDWTESERTHYQMYETVTEGTPISPVMDSPESLARWLTDNEANAGAGATASYDGWLRVCKGGYAPSFVMAGGVFGNGVDMG